SAGTGRCRRRSFPNPGRDAQPPAAYFGCSGGGTGRTLRVAPVATTDQLWEQALCRNRGQDNPVHTQVRHCPPIVHWSKERDRPMNYLSKENVEEVISLSPLQARLATSGSEVGRHAAQAIYTLEGTI